jgi:hypothetical protein
MISSRAKDIVERRESIGAIQGGVNVAEEMAIVDTSKK